MALAKDRDSAWKCSQCGHTFGKFLNGCEILLYGQNNTEFKAIIDKIMAICPVCGSEEVAESRLLPIAVIKALDKSKPKGQLDSGLVVWDEGGFVETLLTNIRMEAMGIKTYDDVIKRSPPRELELPQVKRNKFLQELTSRERDAYKIIVKSYEGKWWNDEIVDTLKKEMTLPKKEAVLLYETVLDKFAQFNGWEKNWRQYG